MLPLDTFSAAAEAALRAKDRDPAEMTIAIRLDLDFDGQFGESWLVYDKARHEMIRLLGDPDTIRSELSDEELRRKKHKKTLGDILSSDLHMRASSVTMVNALDLTLFTDPAVDAFVSSVRVVYQQHTEPAPDTEGKSDEEKKKILDPWIKDGVAFIAAYCTNSCKQRLYAFNEIVDRLERGEEVREDDPIFEQFNARCPKCGRVYEDQKRKVCTFCVDRSTLFKRMFSYFAPHKKFFLVIFACMAISNAISLVNPILSGTILYDRVIVPEGDLHTTGWLILVLSAIFGLALLSLANSIISGRTLTRIDNRVVKNMKQDIFSSMQHLSMSFFNKYSTGNLINRVDYDAPTVASFFVNQIPSLVSNLIILIGLTVFLFILNWKLTLLVFIPVPLVVIVFKFMLPKMWKQYTRQWRASTAMNSVLSDSLSGIRVVKAFAKEAEESSRFLRVSERVYEVNLKTNLISLSIFPMLILLMSVSSRAVWGYGGMLVMDKAMTYGEFSAYLGYVGMIFGPIQYFINFTDTLTNAINCAQRMLQVLDAKSDISDAADAVDIGQIRGDIEFRDVNFHYNPNRQILKNMNIKIHAGDNVGLVGHTGSGKSTIVNLITRMYDVVSGAIIIDGVDVKKIRTDVLRRNVAIVSQEIFLFRGTIAENIRYARPEATMAEVIAAARAANAHDFIEQLPQGYETDVGIGSRSLSGGEKQRISIARALLMSPTLLILDEATAAMDTETERLIGDALAKLVKGRTTISIAHRLSTLKDCNYLFAIENGEIAEEGTPQELLAKKGVYYKLYKLQNEAMKKVLSGT